jgi:hypothetical protein
MSEAEVDPFAWCCRDYTVRKLSRKKLHCPGLFQIGCIYSAYEEQKISTLYQLHTSVIFAVACLTAY